MARAAERWRFQRRGIQAFTPLIVSLELDLFIGWFAANASYHPSAAREFRPGAAESTSADVPMSSSLFELLCWGRAFQAPSRSRPAEVQALAVPLLRLFGPRAGFVTLRQTFVHCCHGGNCSGRASTRSNEGVFGEQIWLGVPMRGL